MESDSRDFVTGTFVWSGFDCEFDMFVENSVSVSYIQTLCIFAAPGKLHILHTDDAAVATTIISAVAADDQAAAGAFFRLRRGAWFPPEYQVPRYGL